MLDIGWSELLLIAVVAIVVIGPKELPAAMRSLGRATSKLRRLAGEFRGHFDEALREANLEDVKREFDTFRQTAASLRAPFNPGTFVEHQIKSAVDKDAIDHYGIFPPQASAAANAEASPPVVQSEQAEPIPSAFAPLAIFRVGQRP